MRMRIKEKCLPCMVDQVIKVAKLTGAKDREVLYKLIFKKLSEMDFNKTTPELIGENFRILKQHIGCEDPYLETRKYYNELFLVQLDSFEAKIDQAEDPFYLAVKYAILGNVIDFNPIHNSCMSDILERFWQIEKQQLTIDHTDALIRDIKKGKKLLYLGDKCGEICLDKLLLKKIKALNPDIQLYFGVRGEPVVNDSISEDAYSVGIDAYATVISNGDCSLGTVLGRTSEAFRRLYEEVDVVLAKGQANYECLSEEEKNIYFLLFTKCQMIAEDIGTSEQAMICLNQKQKQKQKTLD